MNKTTSAIVEILGWIFFISIPLGIWIDSYRWKLIVTGFYCLGIAIVITLSQNDKGKKK